MLHTTNGPEYISKHFDGFLKIQGIARRISSLYTLLQNEVAERADHIIVKMARSMLHARNLGFGYYVEAIVIAVYTKNMWPTSVLTSETLEEAWSGRKPCIFIYEDF